MTEARVACRTPAEGRDGATSIPEWKFDAVRRGIHAALAAGPLPFKDLREAVCSKLSEEQLSQLGSLGWHVTTVKLELEVRGEVARVAGKGPQVIQRAET
ncbi:hypothetical protein FIU86_01065 [Roseovarius sp. THAF9]|uniref:DUF6958 family protein n=1 Tax=Roseovarius sp. THAF9 TaxID=2587847 RepID=UPI0012678AD3|nr:hypothetical protein [Roseovarius sp. THAF9]QFT91417.1 hypothetical protein FIU86_01065 [Roseovarius sp. THAF9]